MIFACERIQRVVDERDDLSFDSLLRAGIFLIWNTHTCSHTHTHEFVVILLLMQREI